MERQELEVSFLQIKQQAFIEAHLLGRSHSRQGRPIVARGRGAKRPLSPLGSLGLCPAPGEILSGSAAPLATAERESRAVSLWTAGLRGHSVIPGISPVRIDVTEPRLYSLGQQQPTTANRGILID